MPGGLTTEFRKTGLIAKVYDDNLNSWEDFHGQDINIPVVYGYDVGDGPDEWEQTHWSYRGQAAVCIRTTDGAIVRVRIGDPDDAADRQVYRQIITDPTDPDNWTSWSLLYSGSHYAISIQADSTAGLGYRIYHAKSDGLYMDNVLKRAQVGIVRIKPMSGETGWIYIQILSQAPDGERQLQWIYTDDIRVGSPTWRNDAINYNFYRNEMLAVKVVKSDGDHYYRYRSIALEGASRDKASSETMLVERIDMPGVGDNAGLFGAAPNDRFAKWQNVTYLKGPSGQAGFKTISNMFMTEIPTAEFPTAKYLFYNERQRDVPGNVLSNLKLPLFWQRTLDDPRYLSQPTPVGFTIWGFAGVVVWGEHVYICGNDRVLRRPLQSREIDISNYVLSGDYALPRENGAGVGKLLCANPENVLGKLLGMDEDQITGLTDRRLVVAVGRQGVNKAFMDWKRDSSWWISRMVKGKSRDKQQLTVEFGDVWHRLENTFREEVFLVGQIDYSDWNSSGPNNLDAYSNTEGDEFFKHDPGVAGSYNVHIQCTGSSATSTTLFMGWRGENGDFRIRLYEYASVVFRYVDQNNYFKVDVTASGISVKYRQAGGGIISIGSPYNSSISMGPTGVGITVQFRWQNIRVWYGALMVIEIPVIGLIPIYTGYVGIMGITQDSNLWKLIEYNEEETSATLIRRCFAYVDEHDVEILDPEVSSSKHISELWGPQSDINSPAKAVTQLLEASKLEAIWKEDT
jgi:hypothetical protein